MKKGIRTLNQQRAEFALEKVKRIKKTNDKGIMGKYSRNGKRLPSLIVANGLIPTLAFLKSKGETQPVYNTVNEWLKKRGIVNNDALEELIRSDFVKLRLATMEALEFADWLKRICEIELKEE